MAEHEEVLDDIDREILLRLQRDGRLTNVELAHHVHLTPPPVLRRVKRLEQLGAIRGYHADVDPDFINHTLEVFVWIDLAANSAESIRAFEEAVSQLDEVVECHRIFGHPDYFLRVRAADTAAYHRFQEEHLFGLPAVMRVKSVLSMKRVK